VATLIFFMLLLFRVLNNSVSMPVMSSRFFGLRGGIIYRFASIQICCLYTYVVIGLIIKKHISEFDSQAIFFLAFLAVLSFLFFLYFDILFNWLVIKLLKYQGAHSFNHLYDKQAPELDDSDEKAIRRRISELTHMLVHKKNRDASAIPFLEGLSEQYETLKEFDNAIECVNRIITIYEDVKVNKEPANIVNASIYKIGLMERAGKPVGDINILKQSLLDRFPDNRRVKKIIKLQPGL
jgi:hypothetical protein